MKLSDVQRISTKIREAIVTEVQVTNHIAQQESPLEYMPRFIENLSRVVEEIVFEEIEYGRRKYK